MEANELRLGNLIYSNKKVIEVESVSLFYVNVGIHDDGLQINIENCEPIPLTEEWLLKLGFENKHTNIFTKQIIISECTAQEKLKLEGWAGNIFLIIENQFASNGCKHVHELQNLYFALTGEELTI